jgi:hypothetical protein
MKTVMCVVYNEYPQLETRTEGNPKSDVAIS